MNYDLAKLMQEALKKNKNIYKKANNEKHPLQIEFERNHNIDLFDYINTVYKNTDDKIQRDLMMLLKNLLMPNAELDKPLDKLTKYWSDKNNNVTILSVYEKLEKFKKSVENTFAPEEDAIEDIALNEYLKYGIDNEDLEKYIKYFIENKDYSSDMKGAIPEDLLNELGLNKSDSV